jgi:hypothetical protein
MALPSYQMHAAELRLTQGSAASGLASEDSDPLSTANATVPNDFTTIPKRFTRATIV